MKRQTKICLFALITLQLAFPATTQAQGTAFTYQGRLSVGTNAATGLFDLQFGLWNSPSGGNQQGNLLTNTATAVTNGLFTVQLDFGAQFSGAPSWLETGVRSNGETGAFNVLAPRQPLTPTPYSIYAESANATNLVGTLSGAQITPGSIGTAQLSNSLSLWNRSGNNISYSAGFVGINTNASVDALSINGTEDISGGLVVDSTGANNGTLYDMPSLKFGLLSSNPGEGIASKRTAGGNQDGLDFYTAYADRMSIMNNGNVGIGIGATNAATTLQVGGTVTATSFVGNGSGLTNVAAASVLGLTIQPNSSGAPNLILGSSVNYVANGVIGATVSGGGAANYSGGIELINSVAAYFGTVSGGAGNTAGGSYATVPGGNGNTAGGANSFAAGYGANATYDGSFVWSDYEIAGGPFYSLATNSFNVRAQGGAWFVTSGAGLNVDGKFQVNSNGTIECPGTTQTPYGSFNGMIEAYYGANDRYGLAQLTNGITALYSSANDNVSSIQFGEMTGPGSFLSQMTIDHQGRVGIGTNAPNENLTIANVAGYNAGLKLTGANAGGIGMAFENTTSGGHKYDLFTTGPNFQPGNGAFAVLDETAGSYRLVVSPNGNVGIGTNTPGALLDVNGEINCVAINITSDRNAKRDFTTLDPKDVLAKVAALPITEWRYKAEKDKDGAASRHIGPMAQDFSKAFALGQDDRHISIVDEGGVALAAIQGLNQKLEQTEAKNAQLEQTVNELKDLVEQLKQNVAGRQGP